jgi:DNA-directed RNA polymerase subunit RPC12/RpoP
MNENIKVICPDCGGKIIDTRKIIQPYDDFDNYAGFRCGSCSRTLTDGEIEAMSQGSD